MRDKRTQRRPNSPHRINVLSASTDGVLGRLVNITTGGLMFLSKEAFDHGTELTMRLPLPTMANGNTAIELQGVVVWCATDHNPKFNRVGIQFCNLGAEEGYIIETVLQRLHLVG